ncbi:hypothetical protein SCA6_004597 [Theobroma cacao]
MARQARTSGARIVKTFGPNRPELKGRWAFGLNRLACAGQLRWLPMERNHKPNFPISSFTQHQISVSTGCMDFSA